MGSQHGKSFQGCIYWLLYIALTFYMDLNMASPFRVVAYSTHFLYGPQHGESFHGCIYWLLHIALIFYMGLNMANLFRSVFIGCCI